MSLALLLAWATPARGQQVELTGRFSLVWVDPQHGPPPPPLHVLTDDAGRSHVLVRSDDAIRNMGGARALDGRRITVTGSAARARTGEPAVQTQSIRLAPSATPRSATLAATAQVPRHLGTRASVTLLCRFSDSTSMPHPKSEYEQWMGTTYPGLDRYWREVSNGQLNVTGSAVAGWYVLPRTYASYFPDGVNTAGSRAMIDDCVAAADPDVHFPSYAAISIQHNVGGPFAFGWSREPISRDGQSREYGMTLMPSWSSPAVYAHELGHTMGWAHSSGRTATGALRSSLWDLMGSPYAYFDKSLAVPTWVPQQPITFYKYLAGWIPSSRRFVPAPKSSQSIVLERSAQPPSTNGFLMASFPLPGTRSQGYTVEARRFAGSDARLPGEAVIIHRTDADSSKGEWAIVMESDGNDDPNDAGARWTTGESFVDSVAGVTVTVDSTSAAGYGVTLVRGWRLLVQATGSGTVAGTGVSACVATCSAVFGTRGESVTLTASPAAGATFVGWTGDCGGRGSCTLSMHGNRTVTARFAPAAPAFTAAAVFDRLLGASSALSALAVQYLDVLGNQNDRLDVGDVRAWLIDTGVLSASSRSADVLPALERLQRAERTR